MFIVIVHYNFTTLCYLFKDIGSCMFNIVVQLFKLNIVFIKSHKSHNINRNNLEYVEERKTTTSSGIPFLFGFGLVGFSVFIVFLLKAMRYKIDWQRKYDCWVLLCGYWVKCLQKKGLFVKNTILMYIVIKYNHIKEHYFICL